MYSSNLEDVSIQAAVAELGLAEKAGGASWDVTPNLKSPPGHGSKGSRYLELIMHVSIRRVQVSSPSETLAVSH